MPTTKSNDYKWKGKLCPCSKPATMWKLHAPCCDECAGVLDKHYINVERKDKGLKRDPYNYKEENVY